MAIIFSKEHKTFSLQTKNSTYQMKVSDLGHLLHVYYGDKIADEDASFIIKSYDRGFSPNPYDAYNNRTISLDVLPQEISSAGVGDFRVSSIEVENSDYSRAFEGRYTTHRIYKGKYQLEGLPGLRVRAHDIVDTVEIDVQDAATGVMATLCYSVFEDLDIITRSVKITNKGSESMRIKKIMSATVDFLESDYDFIHFDGRYAMEREMNRDHLSYGRHSIGSIRGSSSHQENPFVILCESRATEELGSCYGFSFVYSGNFQCTVQKDQYAQTRLVMGIHPDRFSWELEPGERFDAPEVIMGYSGEGLTRLSHIYHDAFRTNLCDSIYMEKKRPVLINSWEAAYFDINHDLLVEMAKNAVDMGVDLFVMDDGWFGERNDDTAALGDWEVNTKKLPKGLKGLTEEINALGLDFGIWVEPEMVSEQSRLYQAHPEWALKIPNRPVTRSRYQLVLDLSRDDVQQYIFEVIDRILKSGNISYVKWDMNRSISEVWSAQAKGQSQGKVFHKYVLSLYKVLDKIMKAYPDVLFEGCCGGGGRFDAGMLYFHPQIWCSDNTDAVNRLKLQYGTSFGYPISANGSHVSVCPNHQTGRVVPMKTRGVVAMAGTFGYELNPNKMTEEEKAECNELTQSFKNYYELIYKGDYYRLESPYSNSGFVAWAFASKDKKEMLANVVITDKEPNGAQKYLKLRGLEKDKFYKVEGYDGVYSGQILMKAGIPIGFTLGEYESSQYHITLAEK